MKLGKLTSQSLSARLTSDQGLVLEAGPFTTRIHTPIEHFSHFLQHLYADFPMAPPDLPADFRIRLRPPPGLRHFIRPQVVFEHDGVRLFEPFPLSHAPPLFEWGMNWCIGTSAHQYLILHAAVLEKKGHAVIMPALPGSGKSTLCAALMLNGWRLLSDEFGLVRADGLLAPLPRPIPLKNQSIGVIQNFWPQAAMGPEFPNTRKGTVCHLKPSHDSVARMHEAVPPKWIVFPRFNPGSSADMKPLVPSYALLKLATNAFNYDVLGPEGFIRIGRLIRQCRVFNFRYGHLPEALKTFDKLVEVG